MHVMLQCIFESFKNALFPPRCLLCGTFFRPPEKDRPAVAARGVRLKELLFRDGRTLFRELMAPFLCPDCSSDFTPMISPLCPRCGYMLESRDGVEHRCRECPRLPRGVGMVRSAGLYDKSLLGLIHALKYREKIRLARSLGLLLLSVFMRCYGQNQADHLRIGAGNTRTVDVILPVPLHPRRFRKRGFNQSYLLIREWPQRIAEIENRKPAWQIERAALFKKRHASSQTGLGRWQRRENVKNAFGLRDASAVRGKRVLLVDDVYTTGSTAAECVRVLLDGGAARVDVLTLARAAGNRSGR